MEQMADKLELLAQSLGVTVTEIHAHYITWTIANSITWIVFGVGLSLMVIFSAAKTHKDKSKELDYEDKLYLSLAACLVLLVSVTIIAYNIPDLISPQAKAWHYLFRDLN